MGDQTIKQSSTLLKSKIITTIEFLRFCATTKGYSGDAQIQIQQPKIDYKIRSPRYFRYPPDFCIELQTGIKKGWFYTTDNIIYYAWKVLRETNPLLNHLHDGYFIRVPMLRSKYPQWIERMIDKYYRA